LGAIPAVLLVLLVSPTKAIIVAIVYLVIQEIEHSLISPFVMKKAVGLNPLFVIMALLIGGKLMGFIGALLAVPITNIIIILFQEYSLFRKEEKAMFSGNLPQRECEESSIDKQDK
jgi:predicted PurR-regulated permease PerM